MDSDESDMESKVIFNMLINRRPRIYRQRRNFFTYYDDVDFRFRYRMSKEAAWTILELIRHKIQHKTMRNKAMTPEGMFLLTLRYFATGCLQRSDGDLSGVSVRCGSILFKHFN